MPVERRPADPAAVTANAPPCCGPEAAATAVVAALAAGGWNRVRVVVVGPRGSGRSHVLRAVRAAVQDRGVTTGSPSAWAVDRLGAATWASTGIVLLDDAALDDDLRTSRGDVPTDLPPGVCVVRVGDRLDAGHPSGERVIEVTPWCRRHAGNVLDQLPRPPVEPVRTRLLAQAAGNPLAVTELGRRAAEHPEWGQPGFVVLPLPPGLVQVFAPGLVDLPPPAREGLAVAAAARGDVRLVRCVVPRAGSDAGWTVALSTGWVRVRGERLHFGHPMTRAAALHAVSPSRMRVLRRGLADALGTGTASRAWHLVLAGGAPDEAAATALERAAVRLTAAGAARAAIELLATAASATPDPGERDRRYRMAARIARAVDEPEWADTVDVPPATGTRVTVGSSPTRHVDLLLAATDDLARTGRSSRLEEVARAARGRAADAAPDHAEDTDDPVDAALRWWDSTLLGLVDRRAADGAPCDDADDAPRETTGPATAPTPALRQVATLTATPATAVTRAIGTAALLADDTELAVEWLESSAASRGGGSVDRDATIALVWALLDAGRAGDARRHAVEVLHERRRHQRHPAVVGAEVALAVLDGWRSAAPGESLTAAAHLFDPVDRPDLAVRLGRARAAAAAAAGRHHDAWRTLRALWDDDGRPRHALLSDLAVADLAAAAAHTDRRPAAARLVALAEARDVGRQSPRRRLLLHRAHALLADGGRSEDHFQLAVGTLGGDGWPLERALAQVDYAEWLRRRRRPADARPHLEAAAGTFTAAEAPVWAARTERELAAGRRVRTTPAAAVTLTAQERRVADLAAQGLSNREIADRLYVSVRTVTTNLTHVFHLLGVRRRMQLGAGLARLDARQQ